MSKIQRNFIAGRMNKVVDERLVPEGEYIDAMNIRMGSTEQSEIGVIENTKGNEALTSLLYIDGTPLSAEARCIGAIDDSARETIYWFVHDPAFTVGNTGKLDLIVSYNVFTNILTYHVISINDGNDINTTLNFSSSYLITGVDIIGDLLFFTDDYNPPRFININRNYPNPIADVDQFTAESILVIKKPPTASPDVQPLSTAGQENYMDTRFICFAYRYKYADGEYSATSQWSAPMFVPNAFQFSPNSDLNEGMVNSANTAVITYNTGGPLVVGIDLLFKQANNNIIKVIEKLDKAQSGLADNTDYQYTFSNSKIFTVLPESEILRLYDNVPLLAKAQTIMGNRLMYGNYVEGYDLIDKNGFPTRISYQTNLITETIGDSSLTTSFGPSTYSIGGFSHTILNSVAKIDMGGVPLVAGASLSVDLTIKGVLFDGDAPFPTNHTPDTTFTLTFFLPQDYASVYDMVSSLTFQNAVGTLSNILPVYSSIPGAPTSDQGTTLTDQANTLIPQQLITTSAVGSVTKTYSAITGAIPDPVTYFGVGQPIALLNVTPGNAFIELQIIAMAYHDDPTAPSQQVVEYYSFVSAQATYQEIASPRSLHSNRGYEIGIVYLDEFNRATTTLVSSNNTEHVPCYNSTTKNSIHVTIPISQRAPSWAKRYRFVCKADGYEYDTIYSNIFFLDPLTQEAYFLLQGENARKIEDGDRLIVKADTSGPAQDCIYATVLEKKSQESGFITPVSGVTVPAGVYMKINPSNFSTVQSPDSVVSPGTIQTDENNPGDFPLQRYPMNLFRGSGFDPSHPLWTFEDYDIPAGSVIKLSIKWQRTGTGSGNRACERREYTLEKTLTSSSNYANMYDWWVGDNVQAIINDGTQSVGGSGGPITNQFLSGLGTLSSTSQSINYLQFNRDATTNELYLQITGTNRCTGITGKAGRRSSIITNFQVFRADTLLIFETQPSETLPDVFFENDLSFPIDADGNHLSNGASGDISQDINSNIQGYIDTGFFNCYAFGNGVESYKIRDSIIGKSINLGNRVTSVSAQDYKRADRFADITYSGIYNQESNLNKLNEFNLGLLNYKNLEVSFGEIFILDGRETDVLTLQEDKISYVLAGKNLLSDSAAGGAITSVPEVLGTQIARTEKYGISFNPESYVQWGYDRYFTDAKRGTVIQLRGNSYSNEQLKVVSELKLRTWFRDMFNTSFNTQKLGGFDPYMNEYVLSTNDIELPGLEQCVECGTTQTLSYNYSPAFGDPPTKIFQYCVDVGPLIGDIILHISSTAATTGDYKVTLDYNGGSTDTGFISGPASGTLSVFKDNNSVEIATITLEYVGFVSVTLSADCPIPTPISLIEVVYTNANDAGETIHTQYQYSSGLFISPLQSNLVVFSGATNLPLVSRYNIVNGLIGQPGFPNEGDTMILETNQIPPDTFVFDPLKHKFMYHRSTTLYDNNDGDMAALYTAATTSTPNNGAGTFYYSSFPVPPNVDGEYLYLIWDLRTATQINMCYTDDGASTRDICCDCAPCPNICIQYTLSNDSRFDPAEIVFPEGLCDNRYQEAVVTLDPDETNVQICAVNLNDINFYVSSGSVTINSIECSCTKECTSTCSMWTLIPDGNGDMLVRYVDCDGNTNDRIYNDIFYHDICVYRTTAPTFPAFGPPGTGTLVPTSPCGCCDQNLCMTMNAYQPAFGSSTSTVSYIDCNGDYQTITLNPDDSVDFCVIKRGGQTPVPIVTLLLGSTEPVLQITQACKCTVQ